MKQTHFITAYKGQEDRQSARVLLILILSVSLAFLFVGLGGIFWHKWILTTVSGLGIILLCVPVLLLRSGRLHISGLVLMLICLVAVTVIATFGQGIRDIALVAFPILFVFQPF